MSQDRVQRLGRGLAALLGESEPSAPAEVRVIAVAMLDPNPHQPRGTVEEPSVADLIASIKIHGILQPLLVRRSPHVSQRFELVAGERRWRAAMALCMESVPCLVYDMDEQQSAAAALVENLQRTDLNPIEEAHGFDRLINHFSLTHEAVAEVVGKSRSHVTNVLRLLKLPEPVQQMVRLGSLSTGHAKALLAHPDPIGAGETIVAKGLSVRQAEALTVRPDDPSHHQASHARDPDAVAIERLLTDQLGLAVSLRLQKGRGSLTLRFSHLDQLDYLLARLGSAVSPAKPAKT